MVLLDLLRSFAALVMRHLAVGDFSNDIDGELGFGIHQNHPLRPSNAQKEQLRNTDQIDPSNSLGN